MLTPVPPGSEVLPPRESTDFTQTKDLFISPLPTPSPMSFPSHLLPLFPFSLFISCCLSASVSLFLCLSSVTLFLNLSLSLSPPTPYVSLTYTPLPTQTPIPLEPLLYPPFALSPPAIPSYLSSSASCPSHQQFSLLILTAFLGSIFATLSLLLPPVFLQCPRFPSPLRLMLPRHLSHALSTPDSCESLHLLCDQTGG